MSRLGVKIMTGVRVELVDTAGVVANGNGIPSATVLWTAGVAPSPLLKLLGAKTDRAGRISVGPFMNVPDVPAVFVVGDASSVVRDGRPVPGVAQAAIQQGQASAHERVCHLARLGRPACHVASPAAEQMAGTNPVVLVLFHWAAQLAIDTGAAEGGRHQPGR